MDIIAHAVAGAASGHVFGRPWLGAFVAVLPDLPLLGQRPAIPPRTYRVTHSLAFVLVAACAGSLAGVGAAVALALLSHLALDLPTHCTAWQPRLLWPSDKVFLEDLEEWEFLNRSWWTGAVVTVIWSVLCLLVP